MATRPRIAFNTAPVLVCTRRRKRARRCLAVRQRARIEAPDCGQGVNASPHSVTVCGKVPLFVHRTTIAGGDVGIANAVREAGVAEPMSPMVTVAVVWAPAAGPLSNTTADPTTPMSVQLLRTRECAGHLLKDARELQRYGTPAISRRIGAVESTRGSPPQTASRFHPA
jgi:hypothetical protein